MIDGGNGNGEFAYGPEDAGGSAVCSCCPAHCWCPMNGLQAGDRVHISAEGHPDFGRVGWVAEVCNGNAVFVDTGDQYEWLGPFVPGDLVLTVGCQWFLNCNRQAVGTVWHPVLGGVPTCGPCRKFAEG